ncbi:MAG: molybdate ABC transporter substrate-binding protein [Cognatishimia sp.]|uniref:molybdate ABC transporter substrate-binding protein n=1 Tax=Cognatishimia sp. TaxID=2211648 RepID=UPI003B8AF53A
MRAIALFCLIFSALPLKADVTVFAAASLRGALDEVNAAYEGKVITSFASSAALARQIAHGAPANVFISANPDWVAYLENDPLVDLQLPQNILSNQLVLIAAAGAKDINLNSLPQNLKGRSLAMPLANAVPAGIYGKEALVNLDLWQAVQPHLVQTDNVRASLALASLGEVDYALVYQTDALADGNVRVVDHVPVELHQPIRYVAAQIGEGVEASEYMAFVASSEARSIFLRHGFLAPSEAK